MKFSRTVGTSHLGYCSLDELCDFSLEVPSCYFCTHGCWKWGAGGKGPWILKFDILLLTFL